MPRFEAAVLAAGRVELHEIRHVGVGRRAAIRARRELLEDLARARRFFSGVRRLADEHALARRRVADTGRVHQAAHFERADAQDAILPAAGHVLLQAVLGLREAPVQEGHRDLVRARRGAEADVLEALVDGVDRRILLLVDRLHVLFAADRRLVDLAGGRWSRPGGSRTPCCRPRSPGPCWRC